MLKYSIVIGTLNRSPQENYLGRTLDNLHRSGLWDTPLPFRVDIVDSRSADNERYLQDEVYRHLHGAKSSHQLVIHLCDDAALTKAAPQWVSTKHGHTRRSRNANALECLRVGVLTGAPWVLFLEDDIDVCHDFLGSVDRWLQEHGRRDRHMYSFATPYKHVEAAFRAGDSAWDFPAHLFYGNQALAFHRREAISALDYIEQRLPTWDTGQGFDLLLKEWVSKTYPRSPMFLSSAPSFVQHIGRESTLHLGRFHTAAGWSGPEWSYAGRAVHHG